MATNVYGEAWASSEFPDTDNVVAEIKWKDQFGIIWQESDSDDTPQTEPGDTYPYEAYLDKLFIDGIAMQSWATSKWIINGESMEETCESLNIEDIIESGRPQWVKEQIAEIGCSFSSESSNYSYNGTIYRDDTQQTLYLSQSGAADLNLTATPVFDEAMPDAAVPAGAVITSMGISATGQQGAGCSTDWI